jgi:hypothetical protein
VRGARLTNRAQQDCDLQALDAGSGAPILMDVGDAAQIHDGDTVECASCGALHVVKSFEWEVRVQVITCARGIHLVGVEHEPVRQRILVDYSAA